MDGSRPLHWVGSSKKDLKGFDEEVRVQIGHALWLAQKGETAESAKPLKGFGGAAVLEIVANYDGDAYRGVYTVKFPKAVYALHVFMKKSKSGIKTPKQEVDLIRKRLAAAEKNYNELYEDESNDKK